MNPFCVRFSAFDVLYQMPAATGKCNDSLPLRSEVTMASWTKIEMMTEDGRRVDTQVPVIVSASRSTDIPAFYSDWFVERLEKGYVKWLNPFSGVPLYVSFAKTRLIVFWTKNPRPMLEKIPGKEETPLDVVERLGLSYYFQFTMNDYDAERVEPNVPPIEARIRTFVDLAQRIGASRHGNDRVVWRFDPLLLMDSLTPQMLLDRIERIGDRIAPHTPRLVFSFIDIQAYAKVSRNLERAGIRVREFERDEMLEVAAGIARLVKGWGISAGTCGEADDLPGIEHNRCVDDRLMVKSFSDDEVLMRFIGAKRAEPTLFEHVSAWEAPIKPKKDFGQRAACGCIRSKDIGEYDTCPHLCRYCYANTSSAIATTNWKQHRVNPNADNITGKYGISHPCRKTGFPDFCNRPLDP